MEKEAVMSRAWPMPVSKLYVRNCMGMGRYKLNADEIKPIVVRQEPTRAVFTEPNKSTSILEGALITKLTPIDDEPIQALFYK